MHCTPACPLRHKDSLEDSDRNVLPPSPRQDGSFIWSVQQAQDLGTDIISLGPEACELKGRAFASHTPQKIPYTKCR